MRKAGTLWIAYFPVLLVSLQVGVNLIYFIDREFYFSKSLYLNMAVGTNLLFPVFLLVLTFKFKFCSVSRAAAIAECLFALYYLIIQKDDVYNILFQITAGGIALIVTAIMYAKKFPFCRFSLFWRFVWSAIVTGSCVRGIERWEDTTRKKHKEIIYSRTDGKYNH